MMAKGKFFTYIIFQLPDQGYLCLQKRRAYSKIEAHMITVSQRKEELRRRLLASGQLVTSERREILELDIVELAERLQHGTLKPTKVLEAFQVLIDYAVQYSCVKVTHLGIQTDLLAYTV